jgi:hypothetical protein
MPEVLQPVSHLRELAVATMSTQLVLRADMTLPQRLHYLVKRNLDNDGVELDAQGAMVLKSNARRATLRVDAARLETEDDYYLALKEEMSEETSTDRHGNLTLTTQLVEVMDVLDIRTLSIWNQSSNSVLSTILQPLE